MPLHHPKDLSDLFAVFPRLDAGESVAMVPVGYGRKVPGIPDAGTVWIGVTSSGSTGVPKLVWKEWGRLKAAASRSEAVSGWTWASPYDPWSYAGVQVAVQAWVGGGGVVSVRGAWDEVWRTLCEEKVDALSCTPTFADLLIQNEPAVGGGWSPRQITLGGEPLRERTGVRLRVRWPEARILTIYAAAEFGVLLRTERTDGWYEAGEWERAGRRWRVVGSRDQKPETRDQRSGDRGQGTEDGGQGTGDGGQETGDGGRRAEVRGRKSKAGGCLGQSSFHPDRRSGMHDLRSGVLEIGEEDSNGEIHWRSTGDRVEIDEAAGLMRVVGRADDVANVAGTKVSLAEVAARAEDVPGVRRAVAVAVENPVTGQVVALRYAVEEGTDEDEVRERLEKYLRENLPKPAWPRDWRVDEVGMGRNAKRKS